MEIFYPETYGAHADEFDDEELFNPNATDNTAAIQLAIDTASAAGGGVVQLGTGTYKITRAIGAPIPEYCLLMKTNVTLKGNGIDMTRLKLADNQFSVGSGFENLSIIATNVGTGDIWMNEFTIMGRRAHQGTLIEPYTTKRMRGVRLNVSSAAKGTLTHIKVMGVGEAGSVYVPGREHFGIELVGGDGFLVDECQVTNTFGSGIAFDGIMDTNPAAHIARNCVVWNNLAMGFALWQTWNARVKYCEAYGNGHGLNDEIGHGTTWYRNNTHNNDIGGVINTDGVESMDVQFLANTITFNVTHGIMLSGIVTNAEIANNEIKDNVNCGIKIKKKGATYHIHDNSCARNGDGAICYPNLTN